MAPHVRRPTIHPHVRAWFAGYPIKATPIPTRFADDAAFLAYVQEAMLASDFVSGVQVNAQDRLVTLCTCSYVMTNARYLLQGVLQPLD